MRKKKRSNGIYRTLAKLAAGALACTWLIASVPLEGVLTEYEVAAPIGALFAGMLLASMFTVVLGTVFVGILAHAIPLWQLVLLAGFGGLIVDIIIFSLFRGTIMQEAKPFMKKWRKKPIIRLLHTRYFQWIIPVLGAIIIASPLPDEVGVSMLGASKISMGRFMALSFVLDSAGALLIALSAQAIL